MKHYALIGRQLGHSWSQRLFEEAVPATVADYRLCEMSSLDGLRQWVADESIDGFNVTFPYKEAVIAHLDALSPEAKAIGAVNCVKVVGDHLIGFNTDAPAFRQSLEETISTFNFQLSTFNLALILGTGGAARAVAYALGQMGIKYTFVSRHPERLKVKDKRLKVIGYAELPTFTSHLSPFTLLINATPVGTWPDVDCTPIQLSTFNFQLSTLLVYDLIYNPSPTLLMRQASERGAKVVDGLAMLRLQAKLSRDIFFTDSTDYQPIAK